MDYLGRNYAAEDTSNYKLVYPNDVVYTKSPTGAFPYGIIKQNRNPYKVIVSPLYGVFKPINKYIGYIIQSYFEVPNRLNKYLSPIIQKGAKNTINISNSTFISKEVVLPENEQEQKKIAQCLASINTQIRQQQKQIDVLIQHKKALLQQLFPQRGQSTPLLRFPEFIHTGEWRYEDGGNLFMPISHRNNDNSLPILAISQDYGAVPREDINYSVFVGEESLANYKLIEKGDFVISLRSFQGGIEYSNIKGLCSPAYVVLRKKKDLHELFYKYYFKTSLFIHELNKNLEGIRDGKIISYAQFAEIQIPVPPTKEEQIKVANYFILVDKLIFTNSSKLEKLQQHKTALLQQLFPN